MKSKIIHGDNKEILDDLEEDCFQMAFADPQFNLGKKYGKKSDDLTTEDYKQLLREWLPKLVRVVKPSGHIFIHHIPKWLKYIAVVLDEYADFRHWIVWDAFGSPRTTPLQPNHYGILMYSRDKSQSKYYKVRQRHDRCRCGLLKKEYGGKIKRVHPFGPAVSDIWYDISRRKWKVHRDAHPCQLPITLLERLLLITTDEGDAVIDPFLGTGTTAVASKRLGRKCVGIEIKKEFCDITQKNLSCTRESKKIGEKYWVSRYLDGEIITLRDDDWNDGLKDYFAYSRNGKGIDKQQAVFTGQKKNISHYF